MSGWLSGHVWKCGRYSNSELTVLLALCDAGEDDGTRIFPSVKKLAIKARLSERQAQRALKQLRDDGIIIRVVTATGKPGLANEYHINMPLLMQWVEDAKTTKCHPSARSRNKSECAVTSDATSEADILSADVSRDTSDCPDTEGQNVTRQTGDIGRVIATETGDSGVATGDTRVATGDICDISPAPPYIDTRPIPVLNTPSTGAGEREAAPIEAPMPAFLRRYPADVQAFVGAWPASDQSPAEIAAAWPKRDAPPISDMLTAVEAYRADVEAQNARRPKGDQRPWMQATTWLRNRRWEGYLAKIKLTTEMARTQPLQVRPWGSNPAADKLIAEIGVDRFDAWLRPCVFSLHEGVPMLTAPSKHVRDYVATHYIEKLETAFGKTVVLQ